MVLVDSSVWIDHFRRSNVHLIALLEDGGILTHPSILGELALGNFKHRTRILQALYDLPIITCAQDHEVLHFIETQQLYGTGIGYIDAHLLAAARLHGTTLLTHDKKLHAAALKLNLAFREY